MNAPTSLIFVWKLDLNSLSTERFLPLLNAEELQRYQRFLDPKKSHEFCCTRGSLRLTIAQHLDVDPKNITFSYSAEKKPFCENHPELTFNVSHSREHALIALNSKGMKIGVDIECHRQVDIKGLSKRFFSSSEYEALQNITHTDQQRAAFFNIWSRKEACVKAFGKGIALGLDTFSVSHDQPAKIISSSSAINPQHNWSIHDLSNHPHYSAAVVSCGPSQIELVTENCLWSNQ